MTISSTINEVLAVKYSPTDIQRLSMKLVDDFMNGTKTMVDASNPVSLCLETSAVLVAAAMEQNSANTRKLYQSLTLNQEDLYLHMSDKDYINRFSTPSKTTFKLYLQKEELIRRLVYDTNTGTKKLIIPRNTIFRVMETKFSIQYPIEIRQLSHGGITVVYDTSIPSPIKSLDSNVIKWGFVTDTKNNGGTWLAMEVEVDQFEIISKRDVVSEAVEFSTEIILSDNYYYTRVFYEKNNTWVEIETTHSAQVYDIYKPTAILKVLEKSIVVRIPQIYVNSKLLGRKLRIDVYQTKGKLDMILGEYTKDAFGAQWLDLDYVNALSKYSTALTVFNNLMAFSTSDVTGGSNPIPFEKLREMVIYNSVGPTLIPITPDQIKNSLELSGYSIIKHIDHVTNRTFLATKPMLEPKKITVTDLNTTDVKQETLLSSAIASMSTIQLALNDLIGNPYVNVNINAITLTPSLLYKTENNIISIVPFKTQSKMETETSTNIANAINSNSYLYTPFHYVLDNTNNLFSVRPYYLDNPVILLKQFINENDTTNIQVSTDYFNITRTTLGYRIGITTLSDASFKSINPTDITVQMMVTLSNKQTKLYINGNLIGRDDKGELAYEFDIITNYHVTDKHNIQITNFTTNANDQYIAELPLITDFDIIFTTTKNMSPYWKPNAIDSVLGRHLLEHNSFGLSHERLRVQMGTSLENLWSRCKTIVSGSDYKTWEQDIPYVHGEDVLQRNADGGTIFFDANNVPYTVIKYKKGDVVLDDKGHIVYKHRVGTVQLDHVTNTPITINPRKLMRQFDLFLIEAAYRFANDDITKLYRGEMVNSLVSWVSDDITRLQKEALEQTKIYFYPKNTLGVISVMIEAGKVIKINAAHKFKLKLYVSNKVYIDYSLRQELFNTTIKGIVDGLQGTNITLGTIRSNLRDLYGEDVIDFSINGLGNNGDIISMKLINESDHCSIAKRLVVKGTGKLAVEECVDIEFIKHELVI